MGYIDYYNNSCYQWRLAKLAPAECYQFRVTSVYPLSVANPPEAPRPEKSIAELVERAAKLGAGAK